MLEVDSVEWHLLENGKAHHTDRFEMLHVESTPILRRAQPFKVSITFKNRPYNEITDVVRLLFNYDKFKPEPRLQALKESTTVSSSNQLNDSKSEWSVKLIGKQNKSITLLVRSPPVAAWGTWNLSLRISHKLDVKIEIWKCPTLFWLLFNPWSKDDDVYMPEEKYLDEYILNDVGKVYTKGVGKPMGMRWIYGQFALPILKVLKKVLDEKKVAVNELESAVELCKHIVNVSIIVQGNWGSNFEGGTKPWMWTGSVPIYEEYLTTGNSAKYAQCYVYAAIFTTALRAAGIPGRNVSNFVSSTSGMQSMSVNYIYDSSGETVDSPTIWNFHVWNDAWMARYDLPSGYGGWQAIDSMGMGLGPASVQAIKKGEICHPRDTSFLFAECNSDRARWTIDENKEYHLVSVDSAYVGRAMLTKQPFIYDPHEDTDFMDLINEYKEPEGSKEERMTVYNAMKYCKKLNKEFEEKLQEEIGDLEEIDWEKPLFTVDVPEEETNIKFKLNEIESISFGESLKAVVIIENTGESLATVEACLGSSSIYYNSATAALIKRERNSVTIQPKSKEEITVEIKPEEYAAKIVEFTLLKIHCMATVKENNYIWANDFQLHVDMPEIIITAKDDLKVNKEGVLMFQFKNLLKKKLTKCNISYEAPGIGRNVKFSCRDVKAEEYITIEHKVKPTKPGEIQINANFNSKELNFLAGSTILDVD